jgi:tyrosine-protein kinase Etk/Wzc
MSMPLPAIGFRHVDDTADVSQFVHTLRRRARAVLILTALTGTAALLHALFATPQFTAQGALYLGETEQAGANAGGSDGTVNLFAYSTQSDVETQIELLTTGTLIERSILETGLNTTLRPVGKPPLTYWRWQFFDGGNTSSFLPGPQSLQVVNATLTGHYRLETGPDNSYRLYAAGGFFRPAKPVLTGTIGQMERTPAGTLLVRFAQPDEDSAAPSNLETPTGAPVEVKPNLSYNLDIVAPDKLAKNLTGGALSVNAGGPPTQPTKLATLQFRWSDPYQAKLFVNQMMNDYIATQLQWKTEAASVTESFVTNQLSNVSQQLAQADRTLADYQAQTGIIDPQQSAQAAVTQMSELQRQRGTVILQLQALQNMRSMISAGGNSVNQYLISEADDPLLTALTTSLAQTQVKLSELDAEYTQGAPDVAIQQAQVTALRASIKSLIRNDVEAAHQNLTDIDRLIASYSDPLKDQPAEALKVDTLKRTADQLGQLDDLLTQKAEQAQISEAATIIDTRIVTPSQLPLDSTSPRLVLTVIVGALAGFIAGVALVFTQHGFSGRYESEEQIRRAVAIPVYGAVPRQDTALTGSASHNALSLPGSFNAFSEAFQLIKRNIYRHTDTSRATTILVISANPQDGKTTIAANLAESLAEDGKRVLLLNCDIYVSRLQCLTNLVDVAGLTDWIRTGERPALQRWPGAKFHVLPAGRAWSAYKERLSEPALTTIIKTLATEFDYLILDSPPLPIVSDGLLLGSFADLILSVINVSHTIRRAFELHKELIDTLDKPHGLIINGADVASYGDTDAYFLGPAQRRPLFTSWFHMPGRDWS